jgi:hypothetical protein
VLGQPIDDYRRDLAVKAKKLLPDGHELRGVQFRALGNAALEVFEPRLLRECKEAAYRADSVPVGEIGTGEVGSIGCVARDHAVPVARATANLSPLAIFHRDYLFATFALNSKRIIDSASESRNRVC